MSHPSVPALFHRSALLLLALAAWTLWFLRADVPPLSAADEAGGAKPPAKAPPLPALKVDKSAPLLLDEPAAKEAKSEAFLRINDACFVCHGNYREEPMAVSHAKEDVSCIDCHGASLAHRNDEDNITPPDKMYPLARVDAGCLAECHDTHDAPARGPQTLAGTLPAEDRFHSNRLHRLSRQPSFAAPHGALEQSDGRAADASGEAEPSGEAGAAESVTLPHPDLLISLTGLSAHPSRHGSDQFDDTAFASQACCI